MPALPARDWPPFSRQELLDALHATNSRSAPGWDHITWKFLKWVLATRTKGHEVILAGFVRLFNAIFSHGVWPAPFRRAVSVLLPKPNKSDYTILKSYRPIVLLSTIAKWMEKVVNNRFTF
ncbi:hypothetical protein BD309DRAFT_814751, partial [Dichomitus squalens]